jgi:predicted ABC-type ATPase
MPLALPHAFCVDHNGTVVDPTWKDGTSYFGVPLKQSFADKTIYARKYYGVIDNMEQKFPLYKGDIPKSEWYDDRVKVKKFNDNHGPDGKFSSSGVSAALERNNSILSRTHGAAPQTGLAAAAPKSITTNADKVAENSKLTAGLVNHYNNHYPTTVAGTKKMVLAMANATNHGLVPQGKVFREWDTEHNAVKYTDVPQEFDKFCEELHNRQGEIKTDPVGLAAWTEHKLNFGDLHPFYDGCGRTSRAVGATILLHGGQSVPVYDEHYSQEAAKGLKEFTAYVRSRMPGRVEKFNPNHGPDGKFASTGGSRATSDTPVPSTEGLQPLMGGGPGEIGGTMAEHLHNGVWDDGRQKLHSHIIREITTGVVPVEHPTVYMMGGGTAAGKSTLLKSGVVTLDPNSCHIDADEIKTKLPEYQKLIGDHDTRAAAYVHEESSEVSKMAMKQALQDHLNCSMDGTGDSGYERFAHKVQSWRDAGAERVVGTYVTCSTETAIARAEARGAATGRYVDPAIIRGIHATVSGILPRACKEGLFDKCELWDTEQGAPRKVMSFSDGKMEIHDQGLWKAFLKKAKG